MTLKPCQNCCPYIKLIAVENIALQMNHFGLTHMQKIIKQQMVGSLSFATTMVCGLAGRGHDIYIEGLWLVANHIGYYYHVPYDGFDLSGDLFYIYVETI